MCQIVTQQEYKLKNTVKAVLSSLGVDFAEANAVTKAIPDFIDGAPATYKKIVHIAENPDEHGDLGPKIIGECKRAYDKLQETFQQYPDVHPAVTKLAGCIVGTGLHAGGVIISSKSLKENLPLMKGTDTAVLPVCQIEMADLDFFRGLKIDVLGLNTLSQVRIAMDITGLDYDWYDSEDTYDPKVYEMLRNGETTDVFQMGSFMATKLIKDMNVDNIEDLTAVNAGNRPGPLAKNKDTGKSMMDLLIERKTSKQVPSIDSRIDHVLAPTMGTILYQEQCMELGQIMAGYSLGASDIRIRKTLGKFLPLKLEIV